MLAWSKLLNTLSKVPSAMPANASQLAAGPAQAAHGRELCTGLRRLQRGLRTGCAGATGQALVPALAAVEAAVGVALETVAAQTASDASAAAWPQGLQRPLATPAVQCLWLDLLALGLPAG